MHYNDDPELYLIDPNLNAWAHELVKAAFPKLKCHFGWQEWRKLYLTVQYDRQGLLVTQYVKMPTCIWREDVVEALKALIEEVGKEVILRVLTEPDRFEGLDPQKKTAGQDLYMQQLKTSLPAWKAGFFTSGVS